MHNSLINMFVSNHFFMDPQTDDLLGSGRALKNGMVVLVEDNMQRVDVSRSNLDGYTNERMIENNRWCEVSELEITSVRRGDGDDLVRFVAIYADGIKRKRTYSVHYAWFVKLDSIPAKNPSGGSLAP